MDSVREGEGGKIPPSTEFSKVLLEWVKRGYPTIVLGTPTPCAPSDVAGKQAQEAQGCPALDWVPWLPWPEAVKSCSIPLARRTGDPAPPP